MIITDLLSSLQALNSQKLNNPIVSNILHVCDYLSRHEDIVFAGCSAILEYRAMSGLILAKTALDSETQVPGRLGLNPLDMPRTPYHRKKW